jgi:ribose transport system permease protein
VPEWLTNLASINGKTFGIGIPPVIVLWFCVFLIVILFMSNSLHGRSFYALGGNRTASKMLSISELKLWVSAYTVSGGMAAITGMLLLGFSGGGFVGVGDPYLFTTVAAVVVGGTSLLGGWGGYHSTVIGALVLTVLTSLLVGIGFSYAAQQAICGLLIVPMVALYARSPHIRMQI